MCNEFRFRQSLDKLRETFLSLGVPLTWAGGAPNLQPRDSVRPTETAPVILGADGRAELRELSWGFPPPEGRKGGPVINFRSDGRRFDQGRCLAPMDGFYEFTGERAPKSKWLFTVAGREFFCAAGLVRGDRFTLLTMPPGPDMSPFHDRQVVILPRRDWAAWLDSAQPQPALTPLPAGTLAVEKIR